MKIEILYFDGCPNHDLAEQRVREALDELELGAKAEIVRVSVKDENMAKEMRFPGSPTVRVNGADVAPGSSEESFSLRCRVYPTSSGFQGAPDKNSIRAAIERTSA